MTEQDFFAVFALCVVTNIVMNYSRSRGPGDPALRAKIDYLYAKTGVVFDPLESAAPDIRRAMASGQKIVAIKLYRQVTGCGLRQAKDAVEDMMREAPKAPRGGMNAR